MTRDDSPLPIFLKHFTVAACLLGACAMASAGEPTAATIAANAAVKKSLPFDDVRDLDFASRGFIATREDPVITSADGRVIRNLGEREWLTGEAPATVNPSLWRSAKLMLMNGLYRVTDRIYQVRGFDLANVTFVRGDTGWIVIDPLASVETAAAAYDLVTEQLGALPVVAIVYTHSHGDHFGGAKGVLEHAAGDIPIIAPAGFMEEAISENVMAGPAMRRRATYHVGDMLPVAPGGRVGTGLAMALANGTPSLVPPNRLVHETGETVSVDGVRMEFQITSGTEAPAEFNIGFPDLRAANVAENANPTQHNILTPRGAKVRDARLWAESLDESIELFDYADALLLSHGWPRFGHAEIVDYLGKQRDAYAYLHNQTVLLMNQGYTPDEVATRVALPEPLAREWYNRPYYGDLSFNARAVYQHYLGWFDGNPAHLAARSPEDAGWRYVAAMGGEAAVIAKAQAAYDTGDYAWTAELMNHLVFSGAQNAQAEALLADAYEQLGFQSENAVWRNFYLAGAHELRNGVYQLPDAANAKVPLDILQSLPTADIFAVLATQIDPQRVGDDTLGIAYHFTDTGESVTMRVRNGVLTYRMKKPTSPVDATLTVTRTAFLEQLVDPGTLARELLFGDAEMEGDPTSFLKLKRWVVKHDKPFNLVTP